MSQSSQEVGKVNGTGSRKMLRLFVFALLFSATIVSAQAPPLLMPVDPSAPPPQQAPQPSSGEYAFRPDLSNPEYGQCLQLEKQWKSLWNTYNQYYQQARTMPPNSAEHSQTAYYLQQLRMQMDTAWNNFSSRCIYFRR
jgi:hypothetical protein